MNTERHSSERIAIVGAGGIGAAWAIVFAAAGFRVNLQDTESGRLDSGRAALMALLRCRRGDAAFEELDPRP